MHKVLSPILDYSLNFEVFHYQYDRWLFKTITVAVNSSRASGCSPNGSLQQKILFCYLLAMAAPLPHRCCPSVWVSIILHDHQPCEWTFPWPSFVPDPHQDQCLEPTNLSTLEMLHVAHILEQRARGYLTGANYNHWQQQLFSNTQTPSSRNVLTSKHNFS